MGAVRYGVKGKKRDEIKFTAKDFVTIKKAIGRLIAADELNFFYENEQDDLTPRQKSIINNYKTTLNKLSHIRKQK